MTTKKIYQQKNPMTAHEVSADKLKILKQRSLLLNKKREIKDLIADEVISGIEFLLNDEHYFIDSEFALEVGHLNELTPIPGAPKYVMGVFNLRGNILTALNLKSFLNLPEKAITNHNRIIILQLHETLLGILADEIIGVKTIQKKHIQPKIAGITNVDNDITMGVSADNLIILDMKKILNDEKIINNQ